MEKKKRAPRLSPEVQRERELILSALDAIVPMLGAMVGDHIEVVLHDLTRPESSVLRIANGHVTGRQPGSPVLAGPGNDKALAILADGKLSAKSHEHISVFPYPTFARDGRSLVSATAMFRDSLGHTFAALCLNADFHSIEAAQALLARMLPARNGAAQEAPKVEVLDTEALMLDIISSAVRRYGKPVQKMGKDEKTSAVEMMLDRGLFMVRGGVERAAGALGVTRFTIYNYLDDVKARRGEAAASLNGTRARG
ncbi:transcriptional regulator [Variovorax sp. Sphag1AA]|uniref:helix-turn-helix transcriptional regulator n=1 Tax=Variovorax sp. Sphag1AA TaxID=2587027 RepID=UPI001608E84B|nr:helix-turn-helix transcriptional regulator [Variovorax sp. Sphag1AA]MBB3178195.1 putative transcriptional regulator YheO [Variovorax sp. Sphag1AA]